MIEKICACVEFCSRFVYIRSDTNTEKVRPIQLERRHIILKYFLLLCTFNTAESKKIFRNEAHTTIQTATRKNTSQYIAYNGVVINLSICIFIWHTAQHTHTYMYIVHIQYE